MLSLGNGLFWGVSLDLVGDPRANSLLLVGDSASALWRVNGLFWTLLASFAGDVRFGDFSCDMLLFVSGDFGGGFSTDFLFVLGEVSCLKRYPSITFECSMWEENKYQGGERAFRSQLISTTGPSNSTLGVINISNYYKRKYCK